MGVLKCITSFNHCIFKKEDLGTMLIQGIQKKRNAALDYNLIALIRFRLQASGL
jgi:hypothetical protein